MKFEVLPNEMLIECFKYLNAPDIFYSFDCLNYRFCKLFRSIPLHLDLKYTKHSSFVQLCNNMLSNIHIRNQIYSLQLFNEGRYDQISSFLSHLSLEQFPHLRLLCLIGLNPDNVLKLICILPLLSNLRHFGFTVEDNGVTDILSSLSTRNLQTLLVPTLERHLELPDQFTSLGNLTISRCSAFRLCQFFKYSPRLQYLSIGILSLRYYNTPIDELRLINEHAVHLKRLVIDDFVGELEFLEILFQRTPNLKLLMISATDDIEMINACRWQRLITVSLPFLDIFKFIFRFKLENDDRDISDLFQHFQTEFWHQQHHWYTEWTLNKNKASIYTIPYMSNKYVLTPTTKRYCNASMENLNIYDNVTDLTLFIEAITDNCNYHFTNVKSLKLDDDLVDENHAYSVLENKHIRFLNMIVKIHNLTHLDMSSMCKIQSPSIILHLLQEIPNISSLKINKDTLFFLFTNNELCKYFNKVIKELDVTDSNIYLSLKSDEIVKLTEIFSNIEHFQCNDGIRDSLQLILDELTKLPHVKVFSCRTPYFQCRNRWLKHHASELDSYSFRIECESVNCNYEDFNHYVNDDDDDGDFYCPPFDYHDSDDNNYPCD